MSAWQDICVMYVASYVMKALLKQVTSEVRTDEQCRKIRSAFSVEATCCYICTAATYSTDYKPKDVDVNMDVESESKIVHKDCSGSESITKMLMLTIGTEQSLCCIIVKKMRGWLPYLY